MNQSKTDLGTVKESQLLRFGAGRAATATGDVGSFGDRKIIAPIITATAVTMYERALSAMFQPAADDFGAAVGLAVDTATARSLLKAF
jgi:hypothetical protein